MLGIFVKFILKFFGKDVISVLGKIVIKICFFIIKEIDKRSKLKIFILGINGKIIINNIINWLIVGDKVVFFNLKGLNMVNGIVSVFINNLRLSYDIVCFEVDEGLLLVVIRYLKLDIFVIINVFRD